MKKIVIYLLCIVAGMTATYGQESLTKANEAYAQEDYIKAIELYEQTAREHGVSSDLYYNLGNAYYKHNEFAKAILNYERALLLNPGNEDARFNLDMANTHIVDKIDPVGRFFLSVWIDSMRSYLSSNTWAVIGIIAFFLFIGGCYLYLFTRSVPLKKIGFFGGIVVLLIAIMANCFAWGLNEKKEIRNEAIVFDATVSVKSSPAESGTDLFVLHEGTKVVVLSKVGEWSEVKISDGNRGWLPSAAIEII
ncbi:tetratricopeptide repeat protein [Barnesiella viscericola]|uniref:Tetratricopeptide repeat protein n=1 Tax=Barnesiella viscericola TaxID=397865 RepID=A0A921MSK0_9BACT|nr:tetratricopeptide repeat protein [Barnesiella viscericola]HJG89284.1 tetratricopeptide repeat protein [Barnesiella viscericola]